jgi:hypothetical protein
VTATGHDGAFAPGPEALLRWRRKYEETADDLLALPPDGLCGLLVAGDRALDGAEVRGLVTFWLVEGMGGRRLDLTVARRALRLLTESAFEDRRRRPDRPPPEPGDRDISRVLAWCLAAADRLSEGA